MSGAAGQNCGKNKKCGKKTRRVGRTSDLAVADDIVNSVGDLVGVVVEAEVTEHHGGGKDHGGRVGNVLALVIRSEG